MRPEGRDLADGYLEDTRWRYADVIIVTVAGFLSAVILGSVGLAMLGSFESGAVELVIVLLAQSAGSVFALAWLSRSRGTGRWATDFGLVIRPRDVGWLFGGLLLQVVAAVALGPIIQLFMPEDAPQQNVVEITSTAQGAGVRILLLVLFVVVAAVIEETTFRGVLLARLRRSFAPWPAVVISALVFSLLHFVLDPGAIYAVPGLFVVGVGLGWAALRTGDLSVPCFIHAGVNLTAALVLLFGGDLADPGTIVWW